MPAASPGLLSRLLQALRAHARTVSGLVLIALLAGMSAFATEWLSDPLRFPLSVVEVKGDFRFQDKEALQAALLPHTRGGFFTVDVDAIRAAAEQLPWIYTASAQRIWPATLRLVVEEQQPAAYWGEDGFLNRHGEAFYPQQVVAGLDLPRLDGPSGREQQVLERYRIVSGTLAALDLRVARMEQDVRRAWQLELEGGITLELGRTLPWQRLQRAVQAWPRVFADRMAGLQRVDLRYSDGFSVYRQPQDEPAPSGRQG